MGSVPSKKLRGEEEEPEPRGDRYRRFNARSITDDVLKGIDLSEKTALITGTSSGIGKFFHTLLFSLITDKLFVDNDEAY